jgi:hypothetical protein
MFHALSYHLNRLRKDKTNAASMRSMVSEYMEKNRDHYIDFITARIRNDDLSNADTEQPTSADLIIEQIEDRDTQREIQWVRYIDELTYGEII